MNPRAEADASQQRHAILNALDQELAAKWAKEGTTGVQTATELPLYLLRKTALDALLEPFELGRVFYHLSQRRGYRSNRKEKASSKEASGKGKKADDLGAVEDGIKELEGAMRLSGARTLGEYFASLDPHAQKVRGRWTARKMYEDEFAAIWEKQSAFHSELLTEELHHPPSSHVERGAADGSTSTVSQGSQSPMKWAYGRLLTASACPGDHAGRNGSERRAGLETGNAGADPPVI